MSDIVERLRRFHAEIVEDDGGKESGQMQMTREAADAIEKRNAEIERLRAELDQAKARIEELTTNCPRCGTVGKEPCGWMGCGDDD